MGRGTLQKTSHVILWTWGHILQQDEEWVKLQLSDVTEQTWQYEGEIASYYLKSILSYI